MDIQEEFKKIDAHFDSISPETLVSDLIECGLGSIRDCTESGWDMVGAKNTEQQIQPDKKENTWT